MEIPIQPEHEARLRRLAAQSGRTAADIVKELIAGYFDHEDWFQKQVRKGIESLDSGHSFLHEDVRRRIDGILGR